MSERPLRWIRIGSLWLTGTLLLSGCYGLGHYSRIYEKRDNTGPGVVSAQKFHMEMEGNRAIREKIHGTADRAQLFARCEYFRNQLVIAERDADDWAKFVWFFPLFWPFHPLTLWQWPYSESQKAWKVQDAARVLEKAYQTDDETFLATCEKLMTESQVGTVFREKNPYANWGEEPR